MTYFNPGIVADGAEDLAILREDMAHALAYGDDHLADLGRRGGGLIFSQFLSGHSDAVAKFEELVTASRTLLGNAKVHVDDTLAAYRTTESANVDQVAALWAKLAADPGTDPVGPPPAGTPTRGSLPSVVLVAPDGMTDHWIWNVLSWPDYLSFGSWIRKLLGLLVGAFGIDDIWMWLWEWLGGDFNKIGDVAEAWEHLSDFFVQLSSELVTRMQIMFTGWNESTDASAAGSYFAKAAQALGADGAASPLDALGDLYRDIAFSSFGFFQAIYSAIDAAIDGLIALVLGVGSVAEAIAMIFTGGTSGVAAVISAIAAVIAEVSSMWGWMMTAVYAFVGLSTLLGAACVDVTWVTLPEG